MNPELINPYSLTEARSDATGFTLLEELVSFRHSVLRVADSHGEIFYVKQYVDEDSFQNESNMLHLIQTSGQPFVVPEVAGQLSDRRINVLTEVKGSPIDMDIIDDRLIQILAKHLRGFHDSVVIDELPIIDYLQQLQIFEELIILSEQVPPEDKLIVESVLSEVRTFFQRGIANPAVVHGDFNHSNVLYDDETDRFGLIDFERVGRGYRSTDVSRAGWRILNNNPDRIMTLLEEYYETTNITTEQLEEFHALQAYDFIGAIAYYAKEGYKNNYPYYASAIQNLQHQIQNL